MEDLGEVLRALGGGGPAEGVLVGLEAGDDAAVLEDGLVVTVDFFAPVVDDAYTWGRIAAVNATSDVYAMGGRPLAALNVVGWPAAVLPVELLSDVLRGGLDAAREAGMAIVGGHTVDDPEPKYGLCVVGRVDPARMLRLDAARPGDLLVLTKPIGTGVITTALKADAAPPQALEAAVASMSRLNAAASQAALAAGVAAATDVTGFGLLGHLQRMAAASGVGAVLWASAVPLLPRARELAASGHVPGGTGRNLRAVGPLVVAEGVDELTLTLLADPQTSGGLLVASPPGAVEALRGGLAGELASAVVGEVVEGEVGQVRVRP